MHDTGPRRTACATQEGVWRVAKTLTIVTAGRYQQQVLRSRGHRYDSPKARTAKRRMTSEAQKRLNLKNSRRQLELRLAATFPTPGSGLVFVLTYRPGEEPGSWDEGDARVNDFRKLVRRERKKRGEQLYMISNTEEHSARHGRLHHHCVVNATGDDFELLQRCWKWGEILEFHPIRTDKEKNWASLAAYMTKESPEKPGKHGWHATRNCPRPEVETFTVPDDTTLQAPSGTHLVECEKRRDEYAVLEAIAYVWPSGSKAPRARRRRKR